MRRDFDYVTFDDYSKDMDELAATAAAVGERQRREIDELKRTIWALVRAAGGRITIHRGHMWAAETGELVRAYLEDRDDHVFIAKSSPPSDKGEG